MLHFFSTCCVLIPNFDGAVMRGRCHLSGTTRSYREEHTAGRGLKVASVLHHFAAGLTQIPELKIQVNLDYFKGCTK